MPKLVVLFFGAENPASALAEAAAEGAAGERFSEVDVRAGSAHQQPAGRRHRVMESPGELLDYAGVMIAAPAAGDVPAELEALLGELEQGGSPGGFAHTVFAVVGGENTVLLGRVARLGGIIVTEPRGIEDPVARARATGKRVAKVVGWIRHALSHEHHH